MDNITLCHKGIFYNISKEPFESNNDAYKRLWYIIKNYSEDINYKELISLSIININKNKGMIYF